MDRDRRAKLSRIVLAGGLVLGACGGSQELLDARVSADADRTDVCDNASPGVRVHLTFGFMSASMTPLWADGRDALQLQTAGGVARQTVESTSLDSAHQITVTMRYAEGTEAGPATAAFYAVSGAMGNWEGSVDFMAMPESCTDVKLTVPFVPCCGNP